MAQEDLTIRQFKINYIMLNPVSMGKHHLGREQTNVVFDNPFVAAVVRLVTPKSFDFLKNCYSSCKIL